jgi:hypothetical protein
MGRRGKDARNVLMTCIFVSTDCLYLQLSPGVLANLQAGFRLESPYWMVGGSRVGYQGDYYSHWFGLSEEPTNTIHQALLQLAETLTPEQRETIEGVEWWAHRRPFGSAGAEGSAEFERTRYLNHHLHYDTDDVAVEEGGDWHHPQISSVLYLTDGSGPTLIINQTKQEPLDPSAVSAVVTPRQNMFMHFKGDLLHTVLPPEAPAPERVTIAIAFWGGDHVGASSGRSISNAKLTPRVPLIDPKVP